MNPRPHSDVLCIQNEAVCLSADHKFPIRVNNRNFTTIRQALTYMLALHSGDDQLREQCMSTNDVDILTELYRGIKYDKLDNMWDIELTKIVKAKFEACAAAKNTIRMYSDKKIVNAEIDTYLGVGESYQVIRWRKQSDWGGRNKLGLAWSQCEGSDSTSS